MLFLLCFVAGIATAVYGQSCGGTLTSESGEITSPNYPNDYANGLNCEWTIEVPGKWITLTFTDFDLEQGLNDCYDSVQVDNKAMMCGDMSSITTVHHGGSRMTVRLTTDTSIRKKGFKASYTSSSSSPSTPGTTAPSTGGCGGDYTSVSGSVTSPNYPNPYPNDVDCTWNIQSPDGETLLLKVDQMDIESHSQCEYDYLQVGDKKYCGSGTVRLKGTSFTVQFKSDSSVAGTGFSLTWEEATCEDYGGNCESSCETNEIVENSDLCSGSSVCCLPKVFPDNCSAVPVKFDSSQHIVGGSESEAHAWPWQVSLQTSGNFHFCGGSIISDRWIITAAHCVDSGVDKIVAGEHDKSSGNHGNEQTKSVAEIHSHEGYSDGAPFPNDIALLKLNDPLVFNEHVQPACPPDKDEEVSSADDCFITGWGDTKGTGDGNKLQELQIDITSRPECREKWGTSYILDTHVCVGNGDIGACNGDSGGPLVCKKGPNSKWKLYGATSWGRSGCQTEGYPNVYTRISKYMDWIETTIRQNR